MLKSPKLPATTTFDHYLFTCLQAPVALLSASVSPVLLFLLSEAIPCFPLDSTAMFCAAACIALSLCVCCGCVGWLPYSTNIAYVAWVCVCVCASLWVHCFCFICNCLHPSTSARAFRLSPLVLPFSTPLSCPSGTPYCHSLFALLFFPYLLRSSYSGNASHLGVYNFLNLKPTSFTCKYFDPS